MAAQRTYLAIDLKSFYASVECVDRHLDPLTTNLVVADASRTEKTICLAVSPSLKAYKIPGRARLFEAVQRVKEVNAQRLQTAIRQKKAVRGKDPQSNHLKMPQCLHDRILFFLRTLGLLCILVFRFMVILSLDDAVLLLHLCDIASPVRYRDWIPLTDDAPTHNPESDRKSPCFPQQSHPVHPC